MQTEILTKKTKTHKCGALWEVPTSQKCDFFMAYCNISENGAVQLFTLSCHFDFQKVFPEFPLGFPV